MKNTERRIYVVGGDFGYCNWMGGKVVRDMKDANLVVFTGGADLTPSLYGKKQHPTTGNNWNRDVAELEEYKKAKQLGLAMIGICRGSQWLAAMNGGSLVQHQSHPYLHSITTNDGRKFITSSTHHQRASLKEIEKDVELLAWAEHLSPYSYGESDQDILDEEKEAEIVYYASTNSLGIQGHPEFFWPTENEEQAKFIDYCREVVTKYLKV